VQRSFRHFPSRLTMFGVSYLCSIREWRRHPDSLDVGTASLLLRARELPLLATAF